MILSLNKIKAPDKMADLLYDEFINRMEIMKVSKFVLAALLSVIATACSNGGSDEQKAPKGKTELENVKPQDLFGEWGPSFQKTQNQDGSETVEELRMKFADGTFTATNTCTFNNQGTKTVLGPVEVTVPADYTDSEIESLEAKVASIHKDGFECKVNVSKQTVSYELNGNTITLTTDEGDVISFQKVGPSFPGAGSRTPSGTNSKEGSNHKSEPDYKFGK